jgi:CRISPR-associated protein Cmr3
MKYIITANDTVYFGRGKTTNAGENSFGAAMFPPFPSVFLGAMRSAFLSQHPEYVPFANEADKDPTMDYEIAFTALSLDGVLHFPAPMDAYIAKDSPKLEYMKLLPNDNLSGHRLPYYLWVDRDGKVANPEGKYISLADLRKYLKGDNTEIPYQNPGKYTEREIRIGIAKDNKIRATAKSMLYNTAMTRLNNLKFVIELKGASQPEPKGLIRLGKYGKTAVYSHEDFEHEISGYIGDNGCFKLYFASPAIFDAGWAPVLPEDLPEIKLIAAAVGGYENAGGYDMRTNRPKTMMRAVKAGSVYYYQLADNTESNRRLIVEKLHGKRISQLYNQAGFGLCYIGAAETGGR